MLNFGIIGDVKLLEEYIRQIRKNKDAQIIGKSSVGINPGPENYQFTIPEFNKIELIDRSDVLIINNFSLISFSTLCDMVKKSKHIFATEYPELSVDECRQLVKLTHEAKTVLQFVNPFYYLPPMQWLNENLSFPALLDISYFNNNVNERNLMIQLLLMLKGTTSVEARKTGAVSFRGHSQDSVFFNLNFQFGDASVVNINYGKMDTFKEFILKGYAEGQFIHFNFLTKNYLLNNKPVKFGSGSPHNQLEIFTDTVTGKKHVVTQINDYLIVIEAIQKIEKKMSQFSGR